MNFEDDCADELERIGVNFQELVTVEIKDAILQERRAQFARKRAKADRLLDPTNNSSLSQILSVSEQEIEELQSQLDEPNRNFHAFQQELEDWEYKRHEIIGDEDTSGTIKYLEKLLQDANGAQDILAVKYSDRVRIAKLIYEKIKRLEEIYRKLYQAVQNFDKQPKANSR